MALGQEVREGCAAIARDARSVHIDLDALDALDPGPAPELDPQRHYLEGPAHDVAAYLLSLDAINFGSGWFPTLKKRPGCSGYFTVSWSLADRWRSGAGWSNPELRALRTEEVADTLGQRRDHELMALFAQALRELGRFLGDRHPLDLVAEAGGSAQRFGRLLADGMAMWHDSGYYKRAQIAGSDLALGRVARFDDLDELTIFADNLVPHVLRCEGVLVYAEDLAAHIESGRLLATGRAEREIRACAVHACAQIARRVGMSERDLDNALWYRGQRDEYKARPRHRTRTIYY
ncbi:MAG: queuosine salvage family protein [Actinomycetota bacterium]|nr:queuosine salvage family protein [Actinomycetota bacterium]